MSDRPTGPKRSPTLEPAGRFEWEQALRLIGMPPITKAVALMLSTYADGDGSSIYPGEVRLAQDLGLRPRAVRSHLARLRDDLCLIERTAKASRTNGRADAYRLVLPDDIAERAAIAERPY